MERVHSILERMRPASQAQVLGLIPSGVSSSHFNSVGLHQMTWKRKGKPRWYTSASQKTFVRMACLPNAFTTGDPRILECSWGPILISPGRERLALSMGDQLGQSFSLSMVLQDKWSNQRSAERKGDWQRNVYFTCLIWRSTEIPRTHWMSEPKGYCEVVRKTTRPRQYCGTGRWTYFLIINLPPCFPPSTITGSNEMF